jgi:hypothetical protein
MTITFPRPIVDNIRMTECWFDLVDNVSFSPSQNGNMLNLSQINDPVWKGSFVTPILERDQRPIWSAWRKSLRGGLNTFTAYDVRNRTPFAYPNAKVSTDILTGWAGTAVVVSLGNSGALSLNSLPAAYRFKAGDRVGIEQGGHYGYHEVLEDVAADGGGNVVITVSPFLYSSLFTAGALCRVWQARCQFMIDQTKWTEIGTVGNTPITFSGIQRL